MLAGGGLGEPAAPVSSIDGPVFEDMMGPGETGGNRALRSPSRKRSEDSSATRRRQSEQDSR